MTLLKGKRRSPNIVRGGRAIPFGNPSDNLYYLQGRSHAKGGIDIGKNPRTGIEAEGGEVVQIKPNELRVLSAQDFIGGGVSPAKQVLAGANPDKVFNEQERFKDRHRLNDDGSKYETGGNKTLKNITRFLFPVPSLIYDAVNYFRNKDDNDNNKIDVNEITETKSVKTGQLPYGYSIRNLYEFENPRRKGIKGKTAKAYDSRTIGAGVDFVSGHPELKDRAKKGIPVQEVNDTAVTHLRNDDRAIMNAYADKYGQSAADTVSHGPRFLAAQARYQQGNIRRVTSKVIKAMAEGNADDLKDAVLEITPKGHKYRQNLVRNFEVYPSKKLNGGMIATINGNIKNGLISTPRPKAKGGTDIHIKPSKRGTFTAAAKAHGKSVQGFASQVLANKDNYSSAMVKKANFARNASKWNHKKYGGRDKAENGKYKTIADIFRSSLPDFYEGQTKVANYSDEKKEAANEIINAVTKNNNDNNDNSVNAVSTANGKVDEIKPKYSRRQQEFYDRGGYNHPAYDSYLLKHESTKSDDGGIRLDDESIPRSNGTKRSGINRNDILGYGQYQRLVENPGDLTADEIIAATNTAERMGRNFNEDRARRSMNQDGAKSTSSSTGGDNGNTSGSTGSSSTTPRRGNGNTSSSSSSNTYSVTNYEIQPDGTLKANGTRTGQGFKQYAKRKNQRTITDARVSRPWRETIGSDADVLNYIANGDAFEHKRWQDRHSKMSQETGYDYSKGRAIQHEDVAGYSHDFNEKFNLANRKLGNYTTPAGKTGDNAQGERRKKCGGRKLAPNGTTTNLERPYEDDWYGAQVEMRQLGKNLNREDYKYLQEQIDARRQSPLRRAVFERKDGYAGVIDELATPEIKGVDVTAPKIDLGPISKTVVPQAQARAAQKDALNRAPFEKNYRDEIGLGLGLAGSILDPILRGRQLRNLESWTPYTESPVKLKTNWNINPQLDRIRESSQEAYRDIDTNTASSSTALARKQRVRNQAQYSTNQQWGIKENKETELINQDKLNLQGVRNRNTTRLNTWAADNARIRNQITMAKADNISNAIQNVVGVGLDYLGRKDFKDYVNNTKAAIAAGAPNVDDRILTANGLNLGDLYNTGIPTLATNPYRRSKFGSRTKLKRR